MPSRNLLRHASRVPLATSLSLLLGFLPCSSGCEREHPFDLYPVVGQVILADTPLVGATVVFHSEASPRLVTGITDENGKFSLSTFEEGDGAVAADYVVTVTKYDVDDSRFNQSSGMDDVVAQPPARIEIGSRVPAVYGDPKTSTLRLTVKADKTNNVVLTLDSP